MITGISYGFIRCKIYRDNFEEETLKKHFPPILLLFGKSSHVKHIAQARNSWSRIILRLRHTK
jgi:hypothetical protein